MSCCPTCYRVYDNDKVIHEEPIQEEARPTVEHSIFGSYLYPEMVQYVQNNISSVSMKVECDGRYCDDHNTGYGYHYDLYSYEFTLPGDAGVYKVNGEFEIKLISKWECSMYIDLISFTRDGKPCYKSIGMFQDKKDDRDSEYEYFYDRVYVFRDDNEVLKIQNGETIMTFDEAASKMKPAKMIQMILCYLQSSVVNSGK